MSCSLSSSDKSLEMQFTSEKACPNLHWEDCDEQIDLAALAAKEPILFYDEVSYFSNCE